MKHRFVFTLFIAMIAILALVTVGSAQSPTGISVQNNDTVHLIYWTDATGVTGASYNIYVSDKAITNIDASNVYRIATKIPAKTEQFEYGLYSPFDSKAVTNFYAVATVTSNGKVIGTVTAGENATTKGAAGTTIYAPTMWWFDTPPAIDANLADWSGVKVVNVNVSSGKFYLAPVADNDADCSYNFGFGCDKTAFYLSYEVTDDVYVNTTQGSTKDLYKGDCVDIYMGTYDKRPSELFHDKYYVTEKGADFSWETTANNNGDVTRTWMYNRAGYAGATAGPFLGSKVASKQNGKGAAGWNVEAALPFEELKKLFTGITFPIAPEFGMAFPFNAAVDDGDDPAGGRQGQLFVSAAGALPDATNSWNNPRGWQNVAVLFDPKVFGRARTSDAGGPTAVQSATWGKIKSFMK